MTKTGIFAPARTPPAIVRRINQEIARYLKSTEAREQLLNAGIEVVASSPESLAATVKSEVVKWGKVIRDAGITGD